MCFDPAATPPPLPADVTTVDVTGHVSGEELVLDSGDAPFRAHLALGPASARTAVVVLPDVRGLFGYYEHLAESFAAAGHHAIALDYFGSRRAWVVSAYLDVRGSFTGRIERMDADTR